MNCIYINHPMESLCTLTPDMSASLVLSNDSFIPGQTVNGTLNIFAPPETFLQVSSIYLQFRGYERIRFRQRTDENQVDGFRAIESSEMTVNTGIPTILPISQPHFLQKVLTCSMIPIRSGKFRDKLAPGSQNSFNFEFKLEGKLPCTTNFSSLKYSAVIEYEIIAQVFCKSGANFTILKPIKLMNLVRKRSFPSFLQQELELKANLKNCLFSFCRPSNNKTIQTANVRADWNRNHFTSGDTVDFTLHTNVGLLSVKLVRELFLFIDERNSFRVIEPVAKLENKSKRKVLVIPPDLGVTVRTGAIDCRYFFVFEVKLKGYATELTTSEVLIY